MSKTKFKIPQQELQIVIFGDEDTVTGFLLTGIGEKNLQGETNYYVVKKETPQKELEAAFQKFLTQGKTMKNIAVILITQNYAEQLRHIINDYNEILPTILEIPSKEIQYEAKKDSLMQRAYKLFKGTDLQ